MKVTEHIKNSSKSLVSFEITPPERGTGKEKVLEKVEVLKKYYPSFIHVTSRAPELEYLESEDKIKKIIKRPRPGTLGVCALIKERYKIDSVCHVLCNGFSKRGTEGLLIDLDYIGIENVFAVQGDERAHKKNSQELNKYSSELVTQIKEMNQGKYLEGLIDAQKTSFCVGVAAYPEKHFSSPNLKTDLDYLKRKVEAGADFMITQMFFDNSKYFNFLEKCEKANIQIPILPGLSTLNLQKQMYLIPKKFHVEIPYEFSNKILNAKTKENIKKIGIDWTTKQAEELISQKIPGVHFFIYQNFKSTIQVLENLKF